MLDDAQMVVGMNDLAQALAERVAGWDYHVEAGENAPETAWLAWAENRDDVSGWYFAPTPAGAVRMLNEALRKAK